MTVLSTIETDVKAVETALTTDIGPATTATKSAIGSLLTKKIDVFGATIPVNKKVTKKIAELAAVAVLAIGLIGTQVYVYLDHKKAIESNSGRTGTLESLAKQTDTNFVNVNAAVIATNKILASVQADQKAEDAKIAALNARLSPVRPTTAVTRKYYRKR